MSVPGLLHWQSLLTDIYIFHPFCRLVPSQTSMLIQKKYHFKQNTAWMSKQQYAIIIYYYPRCNMA